VFFYHLLQTGDLDDEDEDLHFDSEGLGMDTIPGGGTSHAGGSDGGILHLELPTRYSGVSGGTSSTSGANNTSATEAYAMRNIEQSLQILVECIPMHALYTHIHTTNTTNTTSTTNITNTTHTTNNTTTTNYNTTNTNNMPHVYPPLNKDMFEVEVQRAEEAVLEALNAHKAILTPHSLYKCMCMVECVELYGTLHTPAHANCTNTTNITTGDGNIQTLLSSLHTINSTPTTTTPNTTSTNVNALLKKAIQTEHSSVSLQSLASEHSSSRHIYSDADTSAKKAALLRLVAGLLRYPVFTPHLHKTLLTLLDTAVKANTNKYKFDIHTGTTAHLTPHIQEYVSVELPVRMQLLTAYTTLCSIGSNGGSSVNGASVVNSLNMRTMFDRTVSSITTGTSTTPYTNNTNPTSPYNTTATNTTSPHTNTTITTNTASTANTVPHKLIEDIHALCKSNNVRSEAAMWMLRAAQNAELHNSNYTGATGTAGK